MDRGKAVKVDQSTEVPRRTPNRLKTAIAVYTYNIRRIRMTVGQTTKTQRDRYGASVWTRAQLPNRREGGDLTKSTRSFVFASCRTLAQMQAISANGCQYRRKRHGLSQSLNSLHNHILPGHACVDYSRKTTPFRAAFVCICSVRCNQ